MNEPDMMQGDGSTEVAVGTNQDRVVLRFPKVVKWIALDASTAARVADAMLGAAIDLGAQIKIDVPEREITPNQIAAMRKRAEIVINNLLERKMKPDRVASEVVDIILSMSK